MAVRAARASSFALQRLGRWRICATMKWRHLHRTYATNLEDIGQDPYGSPGRDPYAPGRRFGQGDGYPRQRFPGRSRDEEGFAGSFEGRGRAPLTGGGMPDRMGNLGQNLRQLNWEEGVAGQAPKKLLRRAPGSRINDFRTGCSRFQGVERKCRRPEATSQAGDVV